MGQKLKLAGQTVLVTGLMGLVASCSTAPVYTAVPSQKPTQEEIAMLTQLQATDTTALASTETVQLQMQPIDMATDRSIAMAYAIPQPKPLTNDAAAAIATVAQAPVTGVAVRNVEVASADPALLQLQPVVQQPAELNAAATPMLEVQPKTRSLAPFVTSTTNTNLNQLITKYAALYEVPEHLVHHVVRRESNYNPSAVHRGNWGLMQIRYNTAKGMGYSGSPNGLLDAETNLKYAVKYLRGAWIVADRDAKKADWLYRTGYYYQAKKKQLLDEAGLQ